MSDHVVRIEGGYEGGLRCSARHTASGSELVTDAPLDNQGRGESFSPTDLVATALGTCITTIMGIVADRRGLDLSSLRWSVEKRMIADPHRRIASLHVELRLPETLADADRKALERAAHHCPVHASLDPRVEAPIAFVYE